MCCTPGHIIYLQLMFLQCQRIVELLMYRCSFFNYHNMHACKCVVGDVLLVVCVLHGHLLSSVILFAVLMLSEVSGGWCSFL